MTITPASFRADLPEFADVVAYPDTSIAYWAALGAMLISVDRWGPGAVIPTSPPSTLYDFGLEFFAAHNLALEKPAAETAANGGTPGLSQGPVSSKSVAGVSVSYDTQAGLEADAGHWNLTIYGTRFIRMLRMCGAGPIQITGSAPSSPGVGAAWLGPLPWGGW